MTAMDRMDALSICRAAEKEQALFYRALAVEAEARGDDATSQRLHELHADEQHHLSRLTARILELGGTPDDLASAQLQRVPLEEWETVARRREKDEIRRYEILLVQDLDEDTEMLIRQILDVERHHEEELGGKWTTA